jgi:Holliday junction resolvasome RuvABC endonuclease subunit
MISIGIDPGLEGAFVAVDHQHNVVHAEIMPTLNVGKGKSRKRALNMQRIVDLLTEIMGRDLVVSAVLEKQQSMPKQGVSSTFKTGRNFGALEMALVALKIPHETVHPTAWQKATLKGIEGLGKDRSILKAQRAVPTLDLTPGMRRKPHDRLADAACMALYGLGR